MRWKRKREPITGSEGLNSALPSTAHYDIIVLSYLTVIK